LTIRASTIIPAFNSAETLPAAIDSALAQEFEGHEIIVVNDGSTDNTATILAGYGDRIRVVEQPNRGFNEARNVGIERATGKYIALLDADDVWFPGRLSKTVAALEHNPAASLVFSDFVRIDRAGAFVECPTIPAHLTHAPSMDEILTYWWIILPSTVAMPRSIWSRCGGFPSHATAFDLYLFILARECGAFEYLAEPLAQYRLGSAEIGPDKWSPDLFIRVIRERYGVRARGLIADIHSQFSGSYASKALTAMERGNRKEAVRCWRKVFHYDPLYAFKLVHVSRLFRQRNVRRVAQMLWPQRGSK
jgi:glycosyltransferase involved in cell wall biosynthesis